MNNVKKIILIYCLFALTSCDLYKYSLKDNSKQFGHYWVEPWNDKVYSVWVCFDDTLPADIVDEEVIYSSIKYKHILFGINNVYYTNGILVTSKERRKKNNYNILVFDKTIRNRTVRHKTDDKFMLDSFVRANGGELPIRFIKP